MKYLLLCMLLLLGIRPVPQAQEALKPFRLQDIRLLPGLFQKAQDIDKKYLLSLDPNTILFSFKKTAGLVPPSAPDQPGPTGIMLGNYLSALAAMFAATGDSLLLNRINVLMVGLEQCRLASLDTPKVYSEFPALMSGLADAYLVAEALPAGPMLIELANRYHDLVSPMVDVALRNLAKDHQKDLIEALVKLYQLTTDEKFSKLAHRFSDPLLRSISQNKDDLLDMPAKSLLSGIAGVAHLAARIGHEETHETVENFWQDIKENYTNSIGAVDQQPLIDHGKPNTSIMETREGLETCLSSHMIQVARDLFLQKPHAGFIDYYEQTLYNHILSSLHPNGEFVCVTPTRPGMYRVYTASDSAFSCCLGAGMINPARFGELIYARNATDLYVNLFIPSVLTWAEKGIRITQRTSFPENPSTEFLLSCSGMQRFRMRIRYPSWLEKSGLKLQVNKQSFPVQPDENGFISIDRIWMDGDLVKLSLPMTLRAESLPDGSPWISFVKGPVVLAARIADSDSLPNLHRNNSNSDMLPKGPLFPQRKMPIVIQNNKPVTSQLRPVKGQPLAYSASFFSAAPIDSELILTPFYALHDARYFLYWRLATPVQMDSILRTWETEDQQKRLLERKTVDKITPGNAQDEQDHAFRDDESFSGWRFERSFRAAQNGFGYLISNASLKGKILRLTLEGNVNFPEFDVWIDDVRVKTVEPSGQTLDDLIDIDLSIPDNKQYIPTFRIRFTSRNSNGVPPIFHIRLLSE